MAFKRRTYETEEERVTTQAELFASLKKKVASNSEPLPEFIAFGGKNGLPMGSVIKGVVREIYVTSVWDGKRKARKLDKYGNEIPQLNLTIELSDGTKRRQGFFQDLLWKLTAALETLGLEEVPLGIEIASSWVSNKELDSGYEAREHVVQLRQPEAE
jgi:hypothetical protein